MCANYFYGGMVCVMGWLMGIVDGGYLFKGLGDVVKAVVKQGRGIFYWGISFLRGDNCYGKSWTRILVFGRGIWYQGLDGGLVSLW